MDNIPNEIVYNIYTFLDMPSASNFAKTSIRIYQCIPNYMYVHRHKLYKCNEIINNINYEVGKKKFHFRGHEMIGTCMVSHFDRSIGKGMADYSLREFNGIKLIYLYSSKLMIHNNNVYTWDSLQIYSSTDNNDRKQIEIGVNHKKYKKILLSDKIYMKAYKYGPRSLYRVGGDLKHNKLILRD